MKSTLLTVLLTLTLLFSLYHTVASAQEPSCLKVKKISSATLRQGGESKLKVTLTTGRCNILADVAPDGEKALLSLQVTSGLGTGAPAIRIGKLEDKPASGNVRLGHELTAEVMLRASTNTPLGRYAIPATLTYRSADENGNKINQTLSFVVPLKVVPAHSEGQFWRTTGDILLVIVLSPLLIVEGLLGMLPEC